MQSRVRFIATCVLACLAALGAASCGEDEPAVVTPPPPPPPPFQPQSVEVDLGRSGESVTLVTTQAGGYTLDGQAFASGGTRTVTVNGIDITYTLTLAGGRWTADYERGVTVELGASGDTLTLELSDEDGSFRLDGEVVASSFEHEGYRLTLDGQMWTAAARQEVALGALGGTLELTQLASGGWQLADGTEVASGSLVPSGDNRYELTLGADGTWTAEYAAVTQEVTLGALGGTLELARLESGVWRLADGTEVASGSLVPSGDNRYELTLGEDGTWTAEYAAVTQEIALGRTGGTLVLTRLESGVWQLPDGREATGGSLFRNRGITYRLTLEEDGTWTVAIRRNTGGGDSDPMTTRPPIGPIEQDFPLGTSGERLTLRRSAPGAPWMDEDGRVYVDGDIVTMVGPHNLRYRLNLVQDLWHPEYLPRMQDLALGMSGTTLMLMLMQREDGTWTDMDGITRRNGDTVTVGGMDYILRLMDNTWTAEDPPVMQQDVALGSSGTTVTLTQNAAGDWMLNGRTITDGDIAIAMNTAQYTLNLVGGTWVATHRPRNQDIMLGSSGDTLTVSQNEQGRWTDMLEDGDTVMRAGGHNLYRLNISAGIGATWRATYVQQTLVVHLPAQSDTYDLRTVEHVTGSGVFEYLDPGNATVNRNETLRPEVGRSWYSIEWNGPNNSVDNSWLATLPGTLLVNNENFHFERNGDHRDGILGLVASGGLSAIDLGSDAMWRFDLSSVTPGTEMEVNVTDAEGGTMEEQYTVLTGTNDAALATFGIFWNPGTNPGTDQDDALRAGLDVGDYRNVGAFAHSGLVDLNPPRIMNGSATYEGTVVARSHTTRNNPPRPSPMSHQGTIEVTASWQGGTSTTTDMAITIALNSRTPSQMDEFRITGQYSHGSSLLLTSNLEIVVEYGNGDVVDQPATGDESEFHIGFVAGADVVPDSRRPVFESRDTTAANPNVVPEGVIGYFRIVENEYEELQWVGAYGASLQQSP